VAEPVEPADEARPVKQPGWREVIVVAGLAVVAVLAAQVVTGLLPADLQRVVSGTPLLNIVLIVGTLVILVRVAIGRRGR
jgi:uncharacterized membrane-anchored protein